MPAHRPLPQAWGFYAVCATKLRKRLEIDSKPKEIFLECLSDIFLQESPSFYFVKFIYQKTALQKGSSCALMNVKYRSRYSFLPFFRPQKSQLKTQNS